MLQVISPPGHQEKCFLCGQVGHLATECRGRNVQDQDASGKFIDDIPIYKKKYQVGYCHTLMIETCWSYYLVVILFCVLVIGSPSDISIGKFLDDISMYNKNYQVGYCHHTDD